MFTACDIFFKPNVVLNFTTLIPNLSAVYLGLHEAFCSLMLSKKPEDFSLLLE